MPGLVDIFSNNAFGLVSMTEAINKLPYVPGKVSAMKLFQDEGIPTTTVTLEEKAGVVTLVPSARRGAPAAVNGRQKRSQRILACIHLPKEDMVMADEVQNVRAFGSENALEGVAAKVNELMSNMKADIAATWEYLRLGALKGSLLDADGETELVNLFTEFNIPQSTIEFRLTTDATVIRARCLAVKRLIEDALGAGTYNHVHAFVGKDFFDGLIDHPDVRKAYDAAQASNEYRNDPRPGFVYGDITWEEYCGSVTNSAGTGAVKFIADDECRFFPVGTAGLFRNFWAPADFIETVNTIGIPLYAKQAVDQEFQRWTKLHVQSNPLPICTRPGVLVRGIKTTSASSSSSSSSST
jgi:hypothetical protein